MMRNYDVLVEAEMVLSEYSVKSRFREMYDALTEGGIIYITADMVEDEYGRSFIRQFLQFVAEETDGGW
jgi:hypothetical protein